jgi:hypothetical protein
MLHQTKAERPRDAFDEQLEGGQLKDGREREGTHKVSDGVGQMYAATNKVMDNAAP